MFGALRALFHRLQERSDGAGHCREPVDPPFPVGIEVVGGGLAGVSAANTVLECGGKVRLSVSLSIIMIGGC